MDLLLEVVLEPLLVPVPVDVPVPVALASVPVPEAVSDDEDCVWPAVLRFVASAAFVDDADASAVAVCVACAVDAVSIVLN